MPSDPMFDPPEIFVPEPANLVLPEHPNQNTTWLCDSKATRIYEDLHITVNPNAPWAVDNTTRILTRYMLPYMENLADITDTLVNRGKAAEEIYVSNPIDIHFDHDMLVTTLHQIAELHEDVSDYLSLAQSAASLPDVDQEQYLNNHVLKPIFAGSGFAEIGNEDSNWVTFTPLYCEPIKLAVDLDRAVKGHILKWEHMGHESGTPEPNKRSLGSEILGVVALAAAGYYFFGRK